MCDHREFAACVEVNRLEDTQDGDSLACQVDLTVTRAACQTPLQFALPMGLSLVSGAHMSADGTEARLPTRIGLPRESRGAQGFSIRRREGLL